MFTGNYLVIVKQFKSEPAQYGLGINFNVLLLLLFMPIKIRTMVWCDVSVVSVFSYQIALVWYVNIPETSLQRETNL